MERSSLLDRREPVTAHAQRLLAAVRRGPVGRWLPWAASGLVALVLAGVFLDHPVARYAHEHIGPIAAGRRLMRIPEAAIAVSVVIVGTLGLWRAAIGQLRGVWRSTLYAALGLCVALTFTAVLKVWFGRVAPGEWYWQQWRNFIPWYQGSFPSGHLTAMGAIAPFLWRLDRRLLVVWCLGALGAAFGLITQEGHFVSDLIGGFLVGGSVGYAFLCASET